MERPSTPLLLFAAGLLLCTQAAAGTQAATPPRGWNSYDSWTWVINETTFLENCQYVAKHLLPHGYNYCVVDYLWYQNLNATRDGTDYPWSPLDPVDPGALNIDEYGRPQPATDRWPSAAGGIGFKAVADKVHAMGLKFGIHVMRGLPSSAVRAKSPVKGGGGATADQIAVKSAGENSLEGAGPCPWYPGALSVDVSKKGGKAYFDSIYDMFASWGVDFVKNDCVFGNFVPDEIKAASASITKTGREIVYSLSPGTSDLDKAREVAPFVNMYRLTDDVWDNPKKFVDGEMQPLEFVFGSGMAGAKGLNGKSWPDMDMLPVGYIGSQDESGGPTHLSKLSHAQQHALVSMWAIASSPIFFDGECSKMDDFTLSLLTNDEVLAVQGAATNHTTLYLEKDGGLNTGAALASQSTDTPGVHYVGLFHPKGDDYPQPLPNMTIDFKKHFGLPKGSQCTVRDLWAQKNIGKFTNSWTATISDQLQFVLVSVSACSS